MDNYTLPCEIFIYIEGTVNVSTDIGEGVSWGFPGVSFLRDEIRNKRIRNSKIKVTGYIIYVEYMVVY